jgi:hypothetical protein
MLAFGVRAEAEIFGIVYGDRQGREYWGAQLSEPIGMHSLAHVLAVHVAKTAEQLEMARIAIFCAFRNAATAGEDWIIGDTSPLLAMEDGQTDFSGLRKLNVEPRTAVEWLLSKPKRKHLVPDSLRTFLQSSGAPVVAVRPPLTEREAKRLAARYVDDERAAGRRPTLAGLEDAARKAGRRGGRESLRAAFRRLIEVRRGRPPKA